VYLTAAETCAAWVCVGRGAGCAVGVQVVQVHPSRDARGGVLDLRCSAVLRVQHAHYAQQVMLDGSHGDSSAGWGVCAAWASAGRFAPEALGLRH